METQSSLEKTHVSQCCLKTVQKHVQYNPMMVCDECKSLIKCFVEEAAFKNYLKFCESRKREIQTQRKDKYYVMTFKGYESFR